MKRILPGLLIAGFWLLLLLWAPVSLFKVVVICALAVAADEYARMALVPVTGAGDRFLVDTVILFPALLVCLLTDVSILLPACIAGFALAVLFLLYRYRRLADPFLAFARLLFGVFYVGFLGSSIFLLRALPDGAAWILVATAITASSDSAAYFVGGCIGKRKLCPNISPNKTVEGAIGGIIAAVLMAQLFVFLLIPSALGLSLVPMSLLLAVVGIAGDLTESIVKRGTGTKDSGSCLAGHGGVLDRVDSLLFAVPVLYCILLFLADK